jgi:cytochrome oxidase assembly protein ShyY1
LLLWEPCPVRPYLRLVVVMTALWIILGVTAFVLLAVWRLRKAAAKLDRILREEAEETAAVEAPVAEVSDGDDSDTKTLPASNDR